MEEGADPAAVVGAWGEAAVRAAERDPGQAAAYLDSLTDIVGTINLRFPPSTEVRPKTA